jgi:hypothetical protein
MARRLLSARRSSAPPLTTNETLRTRQALLTRRHHHTTGLDTDYVLVTSPSDRESDPSPHSWTLVEGGGSRPNHNNNNNNDNNNNIIPTKQTTTASPPHPLPHPRPLNKYLDADDDPYGEDWLKERPGDAAWGMAFSVVYFYFLWCYCGPWLRSLNWVCFFLLSFPFFFFLFFFLSLPFSLSLAIVSRLTRCVCDFNRTRGVDFPYERVAACAADVSTKTRMEF